MMKVVFTLLLLIFSAAPRLRKFWRRWKVDDDQQMELLEIISLLESLLQEMKPIIEAVATGKCCVFGSESGSGIMIHSQRPAAREILGWIKKEVGGE
jgi:hypothetical protein